MSAEDKRTFQILVALYVNASILSMWAVLDLVTVDTKPWERGTLGEWASGLFGALGILAALAVALYEARGRTSDRNRAELGQRISDIDETRRLVLMVAATTPVGKRPSGELEATIMNALAFHSGITSPGWAGALLRPAWWKDHGVWTKELIRLANILTLEEVRLKADGARWTGKPLHVYEGPEDPSDFRGAEHDND